MPKYGDVVTLVRNGAPLNALVVQEHPQQDGTHLVVIYLDPALAGMTGGSAVDAAVAMAFPPPLKEGGINGWKESQSLTREQTQREQELQKALAALQEKFDAVTDVAQKYLARLDQIVFDFLDGAQPVPAGDPESPHAIPNGTAQPLAHLPALDEVQLREMQRGKEPSALDPTISSPATPTPGPTAISTSTSPTSVEPVPNPIEAPSANPFTELKEIVEEVFDHNDKPSVVESGTIPAGQEDAGPTPAAAAAPSVV